PYLLPPPTISPLSLQHALPISQNPIHHGAHFRLALRHEIAVHVEAEMAVAPRDAPRLVLLERPGMIGAHGHRVVPGGEPLVAIGDRKSTRLNSSHQIISYAVFC